MSDLISRNTLLEMLNYNKAIHEDENGETRQLIAIDINKMIEYVEKIPTAYDVDKVVEEFERKKSDEKDYCVEDKEIVEFCNKLIDDFIEIVKAGGVE